MSFVRLLLSSLTLALSAAAVSAQPMRAAAAPAMPAVMPQDCGKAMPMHEGGGDTAVPMPQSMNCMPAPAAAAPAGGPAKQPRGGHDHGRFHKNQ